jgi:hypothetical protein
MVKIGESEGWVITVGIARFCRVKGVSSLDFGINLMFCCCLEVSEKRIYVLTYDN